MTENDDTNAPTFKADPFYPNRTQSDGLGDYESARTGTENTEASLTRQEFKNEADINWLLARHGANTQVRQGGDYTEVDYSVDLQDAYRLTEEMNNLQAPEELQSKYPTWRHIIMAVETGQYAKDIADLETRKRAEEAARKVQPTDTPA